MDNTFIGSLSKIFEGVDISEEQKEQLTALYFISMYKTIVELLIVLHRKNPQFIESVNSFLTQQIEHLGEEDKKVFNKGVATQQEKLLTTIIDEFMKNAPDDVQEKLQTNVQSLINQSNT